MYPYNNTGVLSGHFIFCVMTSLKRVCLEHIHQVSISLWIFRTEKNSINDWLTKFYFRSKKSISYLIRYEVSYQKYIRILFLGTKNMHQLVIPRTHFLKELLCLISSITTPWFDGLDLGSCWGTTMTISMLKPYSETTMNISQLYWIPQWMNTCK